jgi:hypothetical protein
MVQFSQTFHENGSGGGPLEQIEAADQGGFTRPRGSQQHGELPGPELEREGMEGSYPAREFQAYVFHADHLLLQQLFTGQGSSLLFDFCEQSIIF